MTKMHNIPGTTTWVAKKKKYKKEIVKIAEENTNSEYEFKDGKIPAIENAFHDPVAKKVAYMIATSHEYKKPNVKAALAFTKNYKWELSDAGTNDLQGINKPIIEEKVQNMAKSMKGKKPKPLICVNQFHGIRPQTPGKKILMDGHHRLEACKTNEVSRVPIYKGTYTGGAEKSHEELKEKTAFYKQELLEKVAKENDPFRTTKTVAGVEISNHLLDFGVDVGAAAAVASGGFKGLRNTFKTQGFKGLKNIGKNPVFKSDFKQIMKSQKYVLPIGAAITGAYVGKALYDDLKYKKINDMNKNINKMASENPVPESDIKSLAKRIESDKRPDSKFNKKQLEMGKKIEHEHTSSTPIAKHIAKDHLSEFPNYYTGLKKMEDSLKKSAGLFGKIKSNVPEFAGAIAGRLGEVGKTESSAETAARLRVGLMNRKKVLSERLQKKASDMQKTANIKYRLGEAAIGGLLGGGIGAGIGSRIKDKKTKKTKALSYGLAGAGAGALGAVGLNQLAKKTVGIDHLNDKIKEKAREAINNLEYSEAKKKEKINKFKDEILKNKEYFHDLGTGKFKPNSMFSENFGGIFDDVDESINDLGYRAARNKKEFAEDVARKYKEKTNINASDFKSKLRRGLKANKADYDRQKDKSFRMYFPFKHQDTEAKKLKDVLKDESIDSAIKSNFIDKNRYNFEDKIFSGFRNKKNTNFDKDKDLLNRMWSVKESPEGLKHLGVDTNKAEKEYRNILRNTRKSVSSEYKNYKKTEKQKVESKWRPFINKWEERAKASGDEYSDRGYYNRRTGRTNMSHDSLLDELNAKPNDFKTKDELKSHYRKLAKATHPDVSKDPNATEKFKKINNAMDNLKTTDWYDKLAFYKQELIEKIAKKKSSFELLKENKVNLTPEERKIVMDSKAVWHFNGGSPSPAVWKSVNPKTGEVTYVTNTHRAYNKAPTLKGAITRYHKFIKGTA